jgi:hypothetical protein
MQRVRMSLPYFKQFDWDAEVVTIDPKYADQQKDELLLKMVPNYIEVHYVKALSKKITSKLGLGSIALRSLYFYRKKVDSLLKQKKYDLIYFSTTQFPVCILGAHWKRKFKIPYVIDMQDPWHSTYYLDKPKEQRPPKYWFSYRLNKYLEPIAIKNVDALISVSANYIDQLKSRYPQIKDIPSAVIPFGAFDLDFKIAADNKDNFKPLLTDGTTNVVYIGRGGMDMYKAITPVFEALKQGLATNAELCKNIRLYFIGTSYAAKGGGTPTILPLAKQFNINHLVTEITDRISFYHTLTTLLQADALFIPGSDDPAYNASKLYPYLLSGKPLLSILNPYSPANGILSEFGAEYVYNYDDPEIVNKVEVFLMKVLNGKLSGQIYATEAIDKYSAMNMTVLQCDVFDTVLGNNL